ncbi:F-box/LRR-repeat protein At2g43260-like isoform X2 [Asparagus officinalis]|uniref:F-box/LRR-repeat protein At2g43260-like isoform X2 n=1 Tax=Asparagus officinalis TaxID=4686 RepID=UPI00098E0949|nr:F-box/LRR-repeat protein At2g43260-like isoform X2 [Asparagus officinalis]
MADKKRMDTLQEEVEVDPKKKQRIINSTRERSSSYVVVGKRLRHGEIYKYSNIGDGENSKEIYCKVKLGRVYYQLSNFVDGLTCAYGFTGKSDLYLLNPMTRELQKLGKNSRRREYFKYENFGLGVDLTMGLCKIVRLCTCSDDRRVVQCEVYNVVTMQWRFLGEAPFELFNHSNSVFFRGALHWIGCLPGDGYQDQGIPSIYRFNIKDEKFEPPISLPCPPSPDMHLCPDFGLKELKGKFWLFYLSFDRTYCEIWTMKDYLNSAWVKEYKFHSNNLLSLLEVCCKEIVDNDILFRPYQCESFAFYKESLISPEKLSKASRRRKK